MEVTIVPQSHYNDLSFRGRNIKALCSQAEVTYINGMKGLNLVLEGDVDIDPFGEYLRLMDGDAHIADFAIALPEKHGGRLTIRAFEAAEFYRRQLIGQGVVDQEGKVLLEDLHPVMRDEIARLWPMASDA